MNDCNFLNRHKINRNVTLMKKKDCSFSGKSFVWTLILPMKRYCMKLLSLRTNYAYPILTTLLSPCLYNYVCTLSNKFKMCLWCLSATEIKGKCLWTQRDLERQLEFWIFLQTSFFASCALRSTYISSYLFYFICIISRMMLIQMHTRRKKCSDGKYWTVLFKDVVCALTYLYVT